MIDRRSIEHPSGKLYRGEARNFEHAVQLLLEAIRLERQLRDNPDFLQDEEEKALRALNIYRSDIRSAERRIIMRLTYSNLSRYSWCLEDQDYRELAI